MRAQHSLHKNYSRLRRHSDMRSQGSKATGSSTSTITSQATASPVPERKDGSDSTWHQPISTSEGSYIEERQCMGRGIRPHTSDGGNAARGAYPPAPSPPPNFHSIPEELAKLLITMIPKSEGSDPSGEELAEAFRDGPDAPPVTKQSLCELDIHNIINNIKLRHDVNFDRDLSFRPNLDGAKGQEKVRGTERYRRALIAELELYARLFRGTPSLDGLDQAEWDAITHHAERRIPLLFETIRDVLKSLVPERDHARVDENLDVSKLMQEIERGRCDLVRMAEWLAHLLQEHCAPMRDNWVTQMVSYIREGATTNNSQSSKSIVKGLRELLGILEAMKLDVANHQIRSLKSRLLNDGVNFEKLYHLDRLVKGRAKVNVESATQWYAAASDRFGPQCPPKVRNVSSYQFEVFARAVVASLHGKPGCSDLPETFYLDQDRLRMLKAEIDDLIYMEICMDFFPVVVKQLGYNGTVPVDVEQQVRVALAGIMGETAGHRPQLWIMNSEVLSLEILRQASHLIGLSQSAQFDHLAHLAEANQHLRFMFTERFNFQAAHLEASLLSQVLDVADRHTHSSPLELFNHLVQIPALQTNPITQTPAVLSSASFTASHAHRENIKHTDLANRIAHIMLLHWRVWSNIAYIHGNESTTSPSLPEEDTKASTWHPSRSARSPVPASDEAAIVAAMMTGEAPETSPQAHVAHHTPYQ